MFASSYVFLYCSIFINENFRFARRIKSKKKKMKCAVRKSDVVSRARKTEIDMRKRAKDETKIFVPEKKSENM